jgi:hypothetical protein
LSAEEHNWIIYVSKLLQKEINLNWIGPNLTYIIVLLYRKLKVWALVLRIVNTEKWRFNKKIQGEMFLVGELGRSMRSDGILGVGGSDQSRATAVVVASRRRWLKRRETWLVVLGVALHAVYMLSIFDIYFKTPIVHGMDPVPPRFSEPPAKRLVLLICTYYVVVVLTH